MLFPDENHNDAILISLAGEIAKRPVPMLEPLPCDRWVARSALQKGCRRAEPALAIRALANLFEHDRRAVWRHLVIIAVEDVGVANIGVLKRIVAAQRDRRWRSTVGGEWAVMAELTRQMTDSNHCQAACDLYLRITNDPTLQPLHETALEMDMGELLPRLSDSSRPITERGVYALAAGGGLADGQAHHDAPAVFETLKECACDHAVVETCRAAWKISRNPMTLLFPLVWEAWQSTEQSAIIDDAVPAVQMVNGVPGYALDQFTRLGNIVSRALLSDNPELSSILKDAGISSGGHARAVGDAIFLIEGGRVSCRLIWATGDELRFPHRWMPNVARLGTKLGQIVSQIEAKESQIAKLRSRHLSSDCS